MDLPPGNTTAFRRPRPNRATGILPLLLLLALPLHPAVADTCGALELPPSARVECLAAEIVREFPHPADHFSQGLVYHDGVLYESTGQFGQSLVAKLDPSDGRVLAIKRLPDHLFGEGLARVDQRLVQLTWQAGQVRFYELATLQLLRTGSYEGEGWGLCHDGSKLIRSDGSSRLRFHDPVDFSPRGQVQVSLAGAHPRLLNELECVDGNVYANVWGSDHILRIDADTGDITGIIDASSLFPREERTYEQVLNGIAYNADRDTFFLTGKLWPRLFEVRLVPHP